VVAGRGSRVAGKAVAARLAGPRRSTVVAAAAAALVAAITLLAALGAFSGEDGAATPATRDPRPATPLPNPTAGTIRCSETACTQGGRRVQAPIEDGRCGEGARVGSWARIDAGGTPLYACVPSAAPPGGRTLSLAMPDLTGARLDRAERYLDRLGVGYDTSGGGTFGIVFRENWRVCTTTPTAGTSVAPNGRTKLFVDRSC
jgi:hypothetical protein